MTNQPVRTDLNAAHYRFARMLPHGTLPTRHFSFRDSGHDGSGSPLVSLIVAAVCGAYAAWCALALVE
jgi:hypothetical protein